MVVWAFGSAILYARAFHRPTESTASTSLTTHARTRRIGTAVALSLLPVLFLILALTTRYDSTLAMISFILTGFETAVFLITIFYAFWFRR